MANYLLSDKKDLVDFDNTLASSLTEWKESNFGSGSLFVGRDSILNFTDETSMTIEVHKPDLSDNKNNAWNYNY